MLDGDGVAGYSGHMVDDLGERLVQAGLVTQRQLYGGTQLLFQGACPRLGIDVTFVDGTDPDEWAAATLFEQSTTGTGAFAGDQAQALYVLRDSVSLRVALRGTLGADHAFVMYVDNDVSGVDGLASPTPLDDFVGALDTALSKSMVLPSELRIDAAWGTLDMDRTAAVGDDRMGWRSLFDPSTFTNLPGATVCGTEVCETEIALADLGVAATAEIGLYVRLVSANTAAFSNQTLPLDDGFSPEVVSVYVSIPPP